MRPSEPAADGRDPDERAIDDAPSDDAQSGQARPDEAGGALGAGEGPLRTLRLELSFDGARFAGWQRQAGERSVQGEVEQALDRVLGGTHSVLGAGRTDAGVHARRMVASTRTRSALPVARLTTALDALLPRDVGVLRVSEAAPDFHALKHARWKWYRYQLLEAPTRRPLEEARAWRRARLPPIEGLSAAARALVGRHDFAAFASTGSSQKTSVRTILATRWSAVGRRRRFDVVGDGFLYKMVRTLVGTMLEAAGAPDPEAEMRRVLEGRDRRAAGACVPAHGLTLMDVGYGRRPLPSWGSGPQAAGRGAPPADPGRVGRADALPPSA